MSQLPLFPKSTQEPIDDIYLEDSQLTCHEGDTFAFTQSLPDASVQLIITSPPYNIGKEYEQRTSLESYLAAQRELIEQLTRVLADTGSICWQVGNYVQQGEIFPLDIFFYNIFKEQNLQLRNRIIWHFGHGLHAKKRFSGRYETILWFTKSDNYKFNLDPVRIPSKYPGKRHYKGPNKGKLSGNPLGKNPSDIWEFVAEEWDKEVWNIPNVKSNHPEKTEHPAQFPVELVERCVLALTDENDVVYDPYMGVGSSLIAALKHQRQAIGCDKEGQYIEIAKGRIQALNEGTLKMRPMNKKIHQPSGQEKVAQIPTEWEK